MAFDAMVGINQAYFHAGDLGFARRVAHGGTELDAAPDVEPQAEPDAIMIYQPTHTNSKY